jgi:hypothetical protein
MRGGAQGSYEGNLLSPAKDKTAAQVLMQKYSTSDSLACELAGLSRAAYLCMSLPRDDEKPLRAEVISMAAFGRFVYRTIASMMRSAG